MISLSAKYALSEIDRQGVAGYSLGVDLKELGQRFRAARKARRLSLGQVAQKMATLDKVHAIKISQISEVETGKKRTTLETMELMARAMGAELRLDVVAPDAAVSVQVPAAVADPVGRLGEMEEDRLEAAAIILEHLFLLEVGQVQTIRYMVEQLEVERRKREDRAAAAKVEAGGA